MSKPIIVGANAGFVDAATASARYVGVLFAFLTAFLGLARTKDIAGIINLIQNNGGDVLGAISGLTGIFVAAYGIVKSHTRGSQVASVAANPAVPTSVAKIG
jgi:hypothetical protein